MPVAFCLLISLSCATIRKHEAFRFKDDNAKRFTMESSTANHLPLEPLGAGDLVDRAVRLYRRHFSTLIRISAPPVIISAIGTVLISISRSSMFETTESSSLGLYIMMFLAGLGLWIIGLLFNMVVMGGAARNLITHLLWNEPVSVKTTYINVKSRFGSLLLASIFVGVILTIVFFVVFYVYFWVLFIVAIISGLSFWVLPAPLAVVITAILGIAITLAALWFFFWVAGRFAYIPQVMLVEGRGIGSAMSRSVSLARGNATRLMTMVIFTMFASFSAFSILLSILLGVGWWLGVEIENFDLWPTWYSIAYQIIGQASSILLTPVWMLGLSLLYVDERVRHEGYDIELLAAKRLGDVPKQAPGIQFNPLAPALTVEDSWKGEQQPLQGVRPPQRTSPSNSTLGIR